MSLQRFCQHPIVSVTPDQNIVTACQLLSEKNVGCLVVNDSGKLCGILTDRDIALKVSGQNKDPQQTAVSEVMTRNPVHISVDKTLHELTSLMHSRHVRRVPIVDGSGQVIGLVTLDDLLILLSEEFADLSTGISVALFSKPREAAESELSPPLGWLMTYL